MSDESLFREVDEEVRNEQLQKLWEKYGIYIISACVGVIVAVGGIKGWQYWQHSVAEQAGGEYLKATELVEAGETEQANKVFAELIDSGPDGYATLARFQTAAAQVKNGDAEAAIKAYDAIAADDSVDDMLRSLAKIRAGLLAVETSGLSDVEERLSSLNTRSDPWRNAAREVIALAAYKAGDMAKADRLYTEIVGDLSAPQELRQRAQIMLTLVQPQLPAAPADKPVEPAKE